MLNSHPRRPLLVAFAVFLLAAVAAAALIWHSDRHDRQTERARVFSLASEHAGNLQRSIERSLSATYALAAMVRQGNGTVPNFDEVASQMLPFYPGVSELALVPGGIIRNVVPLAGNEKAVGHDLLKDPAQNKEAFLARDTGKLTLAGPLNLVQGGVGAVGRLPVFLDDAGGKPFFWGFTLVMIRFPEALETVNLPQLAEQGFAWELWRIHPDTGQKQIIAASSTAALIDPVERKLQVPNATWTLSATPVAGWGDAQGLLLKAGLGLFVSLLLAYVAKLLLELRAHEKRLEQLVKQRTAEIGAREADLNRAQSVSHVGSWVLDLTTKELRGSAEAMRIFGVSDGAPFNYRAFLERVHPDDRDAVDRASRASLKGEPYDIDFRILAGAAVRWVHSQAELALDADRRLCRALGTVQDITERKQADEALRASESRYRELFEANPHPMWVWDLQTLGFLAVNDAAVAHYGYSRDEFLAMIVTEIRPPEEVPRLLQRVARVQKQNIRDAGIWRHRRKDGTPIDVEIASHTLVFGGRRAQMVLANDVTERLQAERKLRDSEERYRALTELSSDWYWEQDENLRFTRMSRPDAGQHEIELNTFLGKTRREAKDVAWDESQLVALEAIVAARQPFRDFEIGRTYRNGPKHWVQMSGEPIFDASGRFSGYRGVGKDITERKAAEAKIGRLTNLYAALSQCNQAIVRSASAEELFPQICRDAVQFGGMKVAWIGLVDEASRRVKPVASYGEGIEYLERIEISVDAASVFGRGTVGTAIRENRPVWSQDNLNNPMTAPWRELSARAGWRAVATLPLKRNAVAIGALILFSGEVNAFDEAVRDLLIEMAADISFALDNFERESRRQRAEEALQESEARFRSLTEMSSDFYWESDAEHRLTARDSANKKLSTVSVFQRGAQIGERRWDIPYLSPDEAGWQAHRAMLDAHLPFRKFELSRPGADGSERHISISGDPVFDASGAFKGYRGVGTDITERKAAEAKIQRLTNLYAALSQCNQAIVRCASEEELFPQICRDAVQFGGMKLAWIGLIDPGSGMVRAVASFGDGADEYLQGLEISVDAASPLGRGPTGTAMRENRPFWCQDFLNDPALAPWHERGARLGWGASAALPLLRNGVVVGTFNLNAGEANAFDEAARHLLVEMAMDISYALDHFFRETERRKAEEALHESDARFRSLTEMSSDFYWETDIEHRFTQRSAGHDDSVLSVLAHGAPIGKRRWELPYLSPDEPGWRAHRAVLDAHLPFRDFEFSRLGTDGSELHYSISADPVFDASAAFQGYRGVGTNITRRKRAQAAVAEAKQRLEIALEGSQISVWEIDLRTNEIWFDAAWAAFLGMARAETRTTAAELLTLVHPDDRHSVAAAAVHAIKGKIASYAVEHRVRSANGEWKWILSHGRVIERDAGGQPLRMSGTNTDITGRKREERLLRLEHAVARCLAEASDESSALKTVIRSICETNDWGRGTYWRADDAAGLTRFGESWSLPGAEFERYTEGSRSVVFAPGVGLVGRVWQSGEPLWISDFYNDPRVVQKTLARESGMRSVFVFPVVAAGRTVGVLAFFSRESRHPDERLMAATRMIGSEVGQFLQRMQAEDHVRKLNAELEARVAERTHALEVANKELEAFSYSVSHDLRAPLRAIHGFSRLVEQQYASRIDEQGRDMLRRVGAGAQKMGLLIDDLLRLSRISRQPMQIEPVDLSVLAWEVAGELQAEAPERKVEWVIAPQVSAEGDPGLLRVVLQNLIGNAWKYSSRRDAARIEFGVAEKDGRPAYFVRDNGAGFDMAYAQKLFGAFQRLHAEAEFPGTGIGLATVSRVIHRHGGEVWAEGRVGEGAAFWFSLDRIGGGGGGGNGS